MSNSMDAIKQHEQAEYLEAKRKKASAKNPAEMIFAANAFRQLEGYLDSVALAAQCVQLAKEMIDKLPEKVRNERAREAAEFHINPADLDLHKAYLRAKKKKEKATVAKELTSAAIIFRELYDYLDSAALAEQCEAAASKLKNEEVKGNAAKNGVKSVDADKHEAYLKLKRKTKHAKTAAEMMAIADEFLKLEGYLDSRVLARECRYAASKFNAKKGISTNLVNSCASDSDALRKELWNLNQSLGKEIDELEKDIKNEEQWIARPSGPALLEYCFYFPRISKKRRKLSALKERSKWVDSVLYKRS